MNSGKILYGLKIFSFFRKTVLSASDRITGKEGCQPEEQDGTGHKRNMACPFRDKIRKKKRFLPCIGFLTRPAPDPPRPSDGPPPSFFIFPGRLSSVRESRKTDRRRTEKKLLYPAYFCMLFIQVSGKCLNAGQKNAARQERPGTFPVPAGQDSPQGNGTQFALY